MPSPDKCIESSKTDVARKPAGLDIPAVGAEDSSSYTPTSANSILGFVTPSEDFPPTPSSPKWIDDVEDNDEGAKSTCDIPEKRGDTTEKKDDETNRTDETDGGPVHNTKSPPTPRTPKKGSNSWVESRNQEGAPQKGKCPKCAQSPNQRRKGWSFRGSLERKKHHSCKGSESQCKSRKKSSSSSSVKASSRQRASSDGSASDTPETPMSPRTRELSEKLKNIPGSPRKSERSRSKQSQLHERLLERRVQHEVGHKKLAKKESELKLGKDIANVVDSDEEESQSNLDQTTTGGGDQPRHHHHHKSPRRTRSERKSSHRSRSSSISSRRLSEQDGDNLSFTVPNRWLSYDRLSQSSDCEHRSNGSMIHLEYPYKPSNNQGIYISPYFSSAYRAPGAEILIASLIMIVGVVALITSFATGMEIWLIVGGICLGLGGMFMLLGFCWYCALSSRKKEEDDMQLKIKKLKAILKLEKSPSNHSQVKSEAEIV